MPLVYVHGKYNKYKTKNTCTHIIIGVIFSYIVAFKKAVCINEKVFITLGSVILCHQISWGEVLLGCLAGHHLER